MWEKSKNQKKAVVPPYFWIFGVFWQRAGARAEARVRVVVVVVVESSGWLSPWLFFGSMEDLPWGEVP